MGFDLCISLSGIVGEFVSENARESLLIFSGPSLLPLEGKTRHVQVALHSLMS